MKKQLIKIWDKNNVSKEMELGENTTVKVSSRFYSINGKKLNKKEIMRVSLFERTEHVPQSEKFDLDVDKILEEFGKESDFFKKYNFSAQNYWRAKQKGFTKNSRFYKDCKDYIKKR